MPRSLRTLIGSTLIARDGEIGEIKDAYFDDERWTIRHLVVHTGGWLTGRSVLLSPIAVKEILRGERRAVIVNLTREQVERAPDVDTARPVSRQMEQKLHDHYQWPYYWSGSEAWGIAPYPAALGVPFPVGMPRAPGAGGQGPVGRAEPGLEPPRADASPLEPGGSGGQASAEGDPHLRSAWEMRGYGIASTDGRFGHVEDFVFDERTWKLLYLVIDTVNWWPSKSVLLAPEWTRSISWLERRIEVALPQEAIRGAPEYDAAMPLTRDYEERLHRHYERTGYWAAPAGVRRAGEPAAAPKTERKAR